MLRKNIVFFIFLILIFLGAIGIFQFRIDLTQEKRYTLSPSTIKVLKSIKKPLKVDVYLEGNFPASFKQLQSETRFMLEEFRRINPNIDFEFIDPLEKKMSLRTVKSPKSLSSPMP